MREYDGLFVLFENLKFLSEPIAGDFEVSNINSCRYAKIITSQRSNTFSIQIRFFKYR